MAEELKAPITQQELTTSRVDLDTRAFDVLVEQKGLNICHEIATKCSCIMEVNGSPLSSCISCGGNGWNFSDLKEIKGVLTAISFNPKYMEYSRINLGTANLTVRFEDAQRLAWFDRITVVDGETVFHENIFPHLRNSDADASDLLTYAALSVDKAFLFIDKDTAQQELVKDTDYTLTGRKFVLSTEFRNDLVTEKTGGETDPTHCIGIRYKHRPQYLIMDLQNDIRNTNVVAVGGKEELNHLPVHAVIKKMHYMMGDDGFSQQP